MPSTATARSAWVPERGTIAKLIATAPTGAVSVAAVDLDTGASLSAGVTAGMVTASVVKLQLLETLLLGTGGPLTGDEDEAAIAMIEQGDNSAAEAIFWDAGGHDAVVAAEAALGISTTTTVPGDSDYWVLTTTSAADQLTLLRNLVRASSPLSAAERAYALNLMRNVEADQAWGVTAAADRGTSSAVKNGWLGIDADGGLWAVNSVGIVTADGDQVLIAVLTSTTPPSRQGSTWSRRWRRPRSTPSPGDRQIVSPARGSRAGPAG